MEAHRPLALERLEILVGGSLLASRDAGALTEVRVHQRLSAPNQCELVFVDPVEPMETPKALLLGAKVRVDISGDDEPLFEGEITAIEHRYNAHRRREVRVRAYDILHRLRKRWHTRAFVDVSIADLVREVVADLGVAIGAGPAEPRFARLVQYDESDLDFLTRAARRVGLFLYLRNGSLQLVTLEGEGDPLPLKLGEALWEARLELNANDAARSTKYQGWNPWNVSPRVGQASRPRHARQTPRVDGAMFPVPDPWVASAVVAETDAQADAFAQAELDLRAAREIIFEGVALGNARLRPGRPVAITGVGDPFAGTYVLTAVDHTMDAARGLVSRLSTTLPAAAETVKHPLATWGVVTDVEDPEQLGRIRTRLPALGDIPTDWLCVAAPGAGENKGLLALPAVGDDVLVLSVSDNLAESVAIGSLYGTRKLPAGFSDAKAGGMFVLRSPGGIRLEDAGGNYLQLTNTAVSLHAAGKLEIDAPGSVTIRGKQIDFEQA